MKVRKYSHLTFERKNLNSSLANKFGILFSNEKEGSSIGLYSLVLFLLDYVGGGLSSEGLTVVRFCVAAVCVCFPPRRWNQSGPLPLLVDELAVHAGDAVSTLCAMTTLLGSYVVEMNVGMQ
ncbi:hypothetical protein Tco_0735417 [Tanacetum coccineum]